MTPIETLARKNEKFSKLVAQLGNIELEKRDITFSSLSKIIINQQLSGSAADTIFGRLENLIERKGCKEPNQFLNIPDKDLRTIGISFSKIGFIKDLARRLDGNPDLICSWNSLNDNEALEAIQNLKGFGPWSANIILLSMGRKDVFPFDDTTLKKAYLNIYGKPLSKNLQEIDWAKPFRSFLARYFWRWVDEGMKELT